MPDDDALSELRGAIERLTRNQQQSDRRVEAIERALKIDLQPEPPVVAPEPVVASSVAPEPASSAFETKLGLTWVNRVGAITLILGIAFFFKYAVENQWIGETGRVLLGIVAGMAALAAGDFFWRRDQEIFAQGITGTGIATLYVSFYAAFGFYHLWPQAVVFALLAATTALAGWLALRYSAIAIAALGMFGGYAAPFLLNTGVDHPRILFSFVALLDVSALWLAQLRKWRGLEPIAAVATVFLYADWLINGQRHVEQIAATLFLAVFYALFVRLQPLTYFAAAQVLTAAAIAAVWQPDPSILVVLGLGLSIAGLALADRWRINGGPPFVLLACWFSYLGSLYAAPLPSQLVFSIAALGIFVAWIPLKLLTRHRPVTAPDLLIFGASGIFSFRALYAELSVNHHDVLGLVAVLIAGLYLGLAYVLRAENRSRAVAIGAAIVFATLAIPIQFGGYTVAISWALEAALLVWIARMFERDWMAAAAIPVFALSLGHLFFIDFEMFAGNANFALVWNARFVTGVAVASCHFAAAAWTRNAMQRLGIWVAAHFSLLTALALEVSVWSLRNSRPETVTNTESAAESILFTAYAVVVIGIGVARRGRAERTLGLVLIGVVILKLYFYDVWQLMRVYRIVAFVALGVLLLGASYLFSRRQPPG